MQQVKAPRPLRGDVRLTVRVVVGGELDGVLEVFRLGREVAGLRRLFSVLGKVLVLLENTTARRIRQDCRVTQKSFR